VIFELQSVTLKSRTLAVVEARMRDALAQRTRLSPLGGCWRTEVGVLNQLVLVWPYADAAQQQSVRGEVARCAVWPPAIDEFVIEHDNVTYTAAPFSPPFEPRKLGRLYEIRTYTYASEHIPEVLQAWNELLPRRLTYSPLVAAGHASEGALSRWVHIWAYRDVAERESVREAVSSAGIWPVSVVDQRLKRTPRAVSIRMRNMLAVPVDFSPLC
jgi:NIPSNAP